MRNLLLIMFIEGLLILAGIFAWQRLTIGTFR